jgi:uncharacterized membrane protein YqjE
MGEAANRIAAGAREERLGAASADFARTATSASAAVDKGRQDLSTRELLSRIVHTGFQLVSTEIDLAREEGKANLKAEFAMVKLLVIAGVTALMGLNMLLVAVVFALAHVMPGWLAALLLGGVILVISAIVGYIGWQRRVTRPLAVTRKTVTEDMQWVKERLA